jgi:hypothetical protein
MTWLIKQALSWTVNNAVLKLYSSRSPVGTRLGGHDLDVPDLFLILDIRAGGRILLLGYFQVT